MGHVRWEIADGEWIDLYGGSGWFSDAATPVSDGDRQAEAERHQREDAKRQASIESAAEEAHTQMMLGRQSPKTTAEVLGVAAKAQDHGDRQQARLEREAADRKPPEPKKSAYTQWKESVARQDALAAEPATNADVSQLRKEVRKQGRRLNEVRGRFHD